MDTDSRKAQRDRYAHHRADLLFSNPRAGRRERMPSPAAFHEGAGAELARERVRAGIIGFVSAIATRSV